MADEHRQLVGPVIRGFDPDIVEALQAALEKDNPGVELLVDDHAGYVRVHAPRFLRVTRASLTEALGRPVDLPSLEPAIASFAGRMKYVSDDELTWYLTRED
ncbi:toluene monooxygenase system protein D [Actinomadura pelletieri DSM 43383]|uniref:Toluene monooxygenase system protein D n=1 Tax=Actinomadura pelletieri DSM 43383 TaxID=1120940 RepID=A0A495QXR4_9ACTN|nr:MmoB/DmpM family protein [Actinomadura pelletieri]RKS78706.1 toluene monooxygenase system protein D [Actinomadura pelletieri DSM 43383]